MRGGIVRIKVVECPMCMARLNRYVGAGGKVREGAVYRCQHCKYPFKCGKDGVMREMGPGELLGWAGTDEAQQWKDIKEALVGLDGIERALKLEEMSDYRVRYERRGKAKA